MRKLWGARIRDNRRPLQLMLIALLLSTPGPTMHVHGSAAIPGVPRAASEARAGSLDGTTQTVSTAMQGVDSLVDPLPEAPLAPTPTLGSSLTRGGAAPEDGVEPSALEPSTAGLTDATPTPYGKSLDMVPIEPSAPPAARRERQRSRKREHLDEQAPTLATSAPSLRSRVSEEESSTHVQPVASEQPVAKAPAAPIERAPSVQLEAPSLAQRQRYDDTMRAALAALVRGRLDSAKHHYEQATRIAPGEPTAFRGLGLTAARLGDRAAARSALRRYLTLAPRASDASAIEARIKALD